jgi:hypothetical protein
MSKEVQIKKIVIQIGQKELNFTLEEAKELKDRLIELFPEKVICLSSWPTYIPFQINQPHITPFPSPMYIVIGKVNKI